MHENEEVVLMRFKDIWGKIEIPTNQDDFPHQGFSPKVIKAFGVMSIICAGLAVFDRRIRSSCSGRYQPP